MLKIVLMAGLLASTTTASPIAAGRWQISNDLQESIIDGRRDKIASPRRRPTEVCLSALQAEKGPGLAFSDPELCQVLTSTISGTDFAYTLRCRATESNDLITTKVEGTFTTDSYTGTAVSTQRRGRMRIEMRSTMNAKRVGDC